MGLRHFTAAPRLRCPAPQPEVEGDTVRRIAPGCKAAVVFRDMIVRCREAGLPAPEFRQSVGQFIQTLRRSTPEVTPEFTPEVTG